MLAVALTLSSPATAQPPGRVVSMNLCTDQLALMLAAPGQLVSVSFLAHESAVPALAGAARALPANRGTAEDIVMLRPDLVLAGQFSTTATVTMLRRLGVPVLRLDLATSLDDVATSLHLIGAALGREALAEALIAQFETDRATLAAHVAERLGTDAGRNRAALYSARGFSGGPESLAGDILLAAGLSNIAQELGLTWGGHVALETLIMAAPDLLVTARSNGAGHSQAQALLAHPALRELSGQVSATALSDRDWVCGTPHVLGAVARLIRAWQGGGTAP